MKAILISIQSPHACNILNLIKLWEIRKKFPKDYVGWIYLYVTQALPLLLKNKDSDKVFINKLKAVEKDNLDRFPHIQKFNGKVVARFWCDKVVEYVNGAKIVCGQPAYLNTYKFILKDTCLTENELYDYCEDLSFKAIHITNLEIFDEPKELSEFKVIDYFIEQPRFNGWVKQEIYKQLTKAPQSWCYIEV